MIFLNEKCTFEKLEPVKLQLFYDKLLNSVLVFTLGTIRLFLPTSKLVKVS